MRWKAIALPEPDGRKRGDYGGLAVVFAELAGCGAQWKEALKEWNMLQSQQVLEWQAEGEARGRVQALREVLRGLLEHRFGTLPEDLLAHINTVDDPGRLQGATRQVLDIQSPDQLQL